jgi:hypothetical protein
LPDASKIVATQVALAGQVGGLLGINIVREFIVGRATVEQIIKFCSDHDLQALVDGHRAPEPWLSSRRALSSHGGNRNGKGDGARERPRNRYSRITFRQTVEKMKIVNARLLEP